MAQEDAQAAQTDTLVRGKGSAGKPLKTAIVSSAANNQTGAKSVKRKSHSHPDNNLAATVATMSLAGFPIPKICAALKISADTLAEHYQYEMDNGRVNMMTQVVGSLAQRAIAGSDTAAIFLAKARLGWSDRQSVELTGKDGGPIEIAARQEILTTVNGLLRKGITIDGESEPLD